MRILRIAKKVSTRNRKTVLTSSLLLMLALSSFAQDRSILLYGNIGFSSSKNGGTNNVNPAIKQGTTSSFNFNPGVGYHFSDWTIGIAGGYSHIDDTYSSKLTSKTYNTGAFIRHSFPIAGIFSWWTQLDAGWQGQSYNAGTGDVKTSGFYTTINPALSAAIRNGFAINFSVGGLAYSGLSSQKTFGFTFGNQIAVGLSKNFGL